MTDATEQLIERLAADATPVRRLRPPMLRAGLWLGLVAAVAGAAVALTADLPLFAARAQSPALALEMTGALLAGIAAVVAAYQLSLPDRSGAWALLPLPGLALWLGASGAGCYADWIRFGAEHWDPGESAHCFRFIIGVSVPLGLSLLIALRRARPLAPVRVAALGGLGAAALSAFLLQFFHPFDVTMPDLAVHAVAVGVVAALSAGAGRAAGERDRRPTR